MTSSPASAFTDSLSAAASAAVISTRTAMPETAAEPADPETAKRLLEIGYEQADSERRDVVFDPGSCEHK